MLLVLLLFITTEVFGGALRYYFAEAGVSWLIYVPKLMIVLLVLVASVTEIYRTGIGGPIVVSLMLLLLFSLVGVYYTGNIIQVAFGLYVLLPLLLGLMAEPAFTRFGSRLIPYVTLLWLCAAGGVIYDFFVDTPWSGYAFELSGTEVSSSRQWWAYGGIERVAGFSRASFDVAGQLLFLALPIMLLRRGWFLKSLIWIATGVLIVLTTTKKTVGVYALFTVLLPVMSLYITPRKIKRAVARFLPWVMVAVGIALPVSVLLLDYAFNLQSEWVRFVFNSFEDRLTQMWPDAFHLVFHEGSPIFGRGIGGIGAAQSYFEPVLFNAADNLYLYLYAVFGIFSLPIIGHYTLNVARLKPNQSSWVLLIWFWAISVLMNGWAANGIEGGFTSVLLGITYAYVLRRRPEMLSATRGHIASPNLPRPDIGLPGANDTYKKGVHREKRF